MKHLPTRVVLLLLLAGVGCADPSRCDAIEASLARVRAEAAQRDAQIAWLRWGQLVLAERVGVEGTAGRDALVKRVAALQAANDALAARLQRAERRLDAASADATPSKPAGEDPLHHARPATRTLDETVPY